MVYIHETEVGVCVCVWSCTLCVLALNVQTYCKWYVLALNVQTYCMWYVLVLKTIALGIVKHLIRAIFVVYGEWVNLTIVSAWHLVL